MADEFLPLHDVVRALRDEITTAGAEKPSQGLVFTLGPIELEFAVVAKREGGGNGTIKFGVLGVGAELGGSAKVSSERTQRVKLTLNPEVVGDDGKRSPGEIRRKPMRPQEQGGGP